MALYKLKTKVVTVTTAGTAVPLFSETTLAASLAIIGTDGNVQAIYVGDETVDSSTGVKLNPSKALEVELPNDANGKAMELDLSEIYVDADNDGNTATIVYAVRD